MELIFEIRDAEKSGFFARALSHPTFTQGDTWEELRANLIEAVALHFDDAATRIAGTAHSITELRQVPALRAVVFGRKNHLFVGSNASPTCCPGASNSTRHPKSTPPNDLVC